MFEETLNSINKKLEEREVEIQKLVQQIDNLLTKMSLASFDEDELMISIDNLSDESKDKLKQAVKEENTEEIFHILGIENIQQ